MANKNQPDSIQGQLQQLGRTAGVLANKLTGEFYKVGGWRLFNAGNNKVMLITTVGRKSGRRFTTPIGYIRDKEYFYVLTRRDNGQISNWFRNAQANGKVWLQIEDKRYVGQAEAFADYEQVLPTMQLWARLNPTYFRFLGVNLNGRRTLSEAEVAIAAKKVVTARIKFV